MGVSELQILPSLNTSFGLGLTYSSLRSLFPSLFEVAPSSVHCFSQTLPLPPSECLHITTYYFLLTLLRAVSPTRLWCMDAMTVCTVSC
jgi:hypothetical protein